MYPGQVVVTLSYNPSYSGYRDQEDRSLKPSGANSLLDPILKYLSQKNQKRAGRVSPDKGPKFTPVIKKK
jgi:hypothetical protein